MATTVGRGTQAVNSIYIKPMLRKAYHRKGNCSDVINDAAKLNGDEATNKKSLAGDSWVRDHRTGIYYPKGQEKVIADVPADSGKDIRVNWFSNHEEFI